MANERSTVLIGAGLASLGLLALAVWGASSSSGPGGAPKTERADAQDIEALARMLASENPSASVLVWVEQVWTQLRSRRAGQSIYQRITGGKGWGPQDKVRPVSTAEPATEKHRMVARLVLLGQFLSTLPGARRYFEPKQQDLAFQIAEVARAKLAKGETLTPNEKRLLGYKHDADGLRRKWASEGLRRIDLIDGVEFWT